MFVDQLDDAPQPLTRPVLSHGQSAGIGFPEAKRDRFVVDVEREEHGYSRAVGPLCRLKVATGAHRVHDFHDAVHRPLPAGLGGSLRNRLSLGGQQ